MSQDKQMTEDFQPAAHAERLGKEMMGATEIQRMILQEALDDGTESGRTICGSTDNVKEPIFRSFDAIALDTCPVDHQGLIHAGGGHDLRAPANSLRDISEVLFSNTAAVVVAGTDRSEVFMQPTEDQLEEARLIFQNSVGLEINSHREFLQAVENNRVRNIAAAFTKVRNELGSLIVSVPTNHPNIEKRAVAGAIVSLDTVDVREAINKPAERVGNSLGHFRSAGSEIFDIGPVDQPINLPQLIVQEFTQAAILAGFILLFGGRPTTIARNSVR